MMQETFWTLFHDAAHWEFELFVGFVETLVFVDEIPFPIPAIATSFKGDGG